MPCRLPVDRRLYLAPIRRISPARRRIVRAMHLHHFALVVLHHACAGDQVAIAQTHLTPGREVRLRYGYLITCTSVVKNDQGEVVEVHCTYDPATRGGNTPDGRKVKATIHWESARHSLDAEVRVYETLFDKPDPNQVSEGEEFTANLNPRSLEILRGKLEPSLQSAKPGERFQFERLGYFAVDPDSTPGKLVFNR